MALQGVDVSVTLFSSVQCSSVAQSCPTLCDPMNRSTPGLPVHHQLLEFTQTQRPSSQWCHPAISSSGIPFSSCPQSLPAIKNIFFSHGSLFFFLILSALCCCCCCFVFFNLKNVFKFSFKLLAPPPGMEPLPSAVEVQSPNHWTAGGVPRVALDAASIHKFRLKLPFPRPSSACSNKSYRLQIFKIRRGSCLHTHVWSGVSLQISV